VIDVTRPTCLTAVNLVYEIRSGPSRSTAIDKRPVDGRQAVTGLGLEGDRQCDTRHHGGTDKALYAYAAEDAAWWSAELGRDVTPGLFGENLTTQGLDVTGAVIGERWRIGSPRDGVVVEVRLPREPCSNLSARMGIRDFHQHFARVGNPGAYLKVLATGTVAAGDPIAIEHRPAHGVTLGQVFDAPGPQEMRRLLDSGIDLAEPLRRKALRVLARARSAAREAG
jgi:MOSC domain-containing protein YiiM